MDLVYTPFETEWIDVGSSPDVITSTTPEVITGVKYKTIKVNKNRPNTWKCPACKDGYVWIESSGTTSQNFIPGECRACDESIDHCTSCSSDLSICHSCRYPYIPTYDGTGC